MKIIKKKEINSQNKLIARSFLVQLFWRILAWSSLGIGLAFLGGFFGNKEFISQDILGKIYQTLTRSSEKQLSKFFLGGGMADRRNLLHYALILIGIIIFSNIITNLINLELKLNDRFIENNKYYLYGWLIFTLNTLIRIASYIIITLCFISAQTLIFILLFIFFHTWFSTKKLTEPPTERFLTWQDPIVKKIFICSGLVIIILPLVHYRIERIQQQLTQTNSGNNFKELIISLVNSVPLLKVVFESLAALSSFIHWIVLIWFIRVVITNRINEYNDFWDKKINCINKQATDFKQFYYYQNLLSEANVTSTKPDLPTQTKKMIILGDYNFLQITPNFLKKEYLDKELNSLEHNILKEFSDKIKKIIEFIDFLPLNLNPAGQKESQQKKVNFLIYCLFNEFQSFAEIERTKQLILTKKMSYFQRTKKILPIKVTKT